MKTNAELVENFANKLIELVHSGGDEEAKIVLQSFEPTEIQAVLDLLPAIIMIGIVGDTMELLNK